MKRDEKISNEPKLKAWFDSLQNDHPFELEVKSRSPKESKAFRAVAVFPWDLASLNTLWHGEFSSKPNITQWTKIYEKWSGVVVVGGGSKLRLFLSRPHQQYLPICTIEVPDMRLCYGDEEIIEEADVTCVAWCMVQNADEFWPLVAFSANGILYLYNVEKASYHGVLRGHGGKITSLAVHPIDPCIVASTSYDYTCRLYDLTKRVECKIDNPRWPGKSKMALAGAPFGLRSNEPEGYDYGRCTAILVGGPSGGHLAPVLGAAFHPTYPIIATCGMDRAVKLWRLPVVVGDRVTREDKPLFSSTTIHDSQVLSITWMSKDMLLSNCGEVIVRRKNKEEPEELGLLDTEPGTLILWKWLSLERFFPLDRETWPAMLRGCASDYQGSSSCKVVAKYNLPRPQPSVASQLTARAFVFQSPIHTPLIALPSYGCVHLSSVKHFKPRLPPYLSNKIGVYAAASEGHTSATEKITAATDKLNLNADGEETARNRELPCWIVETTEDNKIRKLGKGAEDAEDQPPKLEACTIAENGRLLIGAGPNEAIWIWRISREKQVRRALVSAEGG